MPLIHLKTRRLEYRFEITQKYNIIRGDSGKGKTTLVELVNAYTVDHHSLQCPGYSKIAALPANALPSYLEQYEDTVVFIDEDNLLLHRYDTATLLQRSKNYFVIISRTARFDYLPVSLDCIFSMKTSGKFHTLEKYYQDYSEYSGKVDLIICEDSRSSLKFLKEVFEEEGVAVQASGEHHEISGISGGKSKIKDSIYLHFKDGIRTMCIVFDRAAIGTNIDGIMNVIVKCKNLKVVFLDWNSFEEYILESPVYGMQIEKAGCAWESQEQYAVALFEEKFPGYDKSMLPFCLRRSRCVECKNAHGCKYKGARFEQLIYWKVKELLDQYN